MADPITPKSTESASSTSYLSFTDDPQIREDVKDISGIPASGSDWDYEGHCEYVVPALGMDWKQPHEETASGPVGTAISTVGSGLASLGKGWADLWYYGTSKAITAGSAILGLPSQGLQAAGVNTDSVLSPGGAAATAGSALEVAGISTGIAYGTNRNTPLSAIAKSLGQQDGGAALAQKYGTTPQTLLKDLSASQKTGLSGRLAGHWWKNEGWKFGLMVGFGQVRFLSNANAFYNTIPGGNAFRDAVGPEYADNGLYAAMTATGLGMAAGTYQKVVLNDPNFKAPDKAVLPEFVAKATGQKRFESIPAKNTKVMPYLSSMGLSAAYMGLTWYFQQVPTQQRVLHDLHGGEDQATGGAYNPANWDSRFVQHHTTASTAFNWGVLAPVWAALGPYTAGISDLYASKIVRPISDKIAGFNNAPAKFVGGLLAPFGNTNADVSAEVNSEAFKKFVAEGRWAPRDPNAPRPGWIRFLEAQAKQLAGKEIKIPRLAEVGEAATMRMPEKLRSVAARVGYGKKIPVTFNQTAWSIPIVVAISQFRAKSQGFDTKDSINGSANGLWTSSLMSQVSASYFLSSKGYASNWDYYFLNMFSQNNQVNSCAQQSEMIYQSAEKLASDYHAAKVSGDPLEEERALVGMAYAYRAGSESERGKIKKLFDQIGADPEAVLVEIDALGAELQ